MLAPALALGRGEDRGPGTVSARGGRRGHTSKVMGLQVKVGGRQDPTWTVIQAWGERRGQHEASSSWPGHSYGWGRGDWALVQPLTQEVEGCWAVASGKGRMARGEETLRVLGEGTE